MGDRTHTAIEFSGTISEEQGWELIQLLNDQGCECNDGNHDLTLASLTSGESFYDSDCNYAQMEDIESWCGDNNVSFLKTWEPGGGYGPGICHYDAATGKTHECASLESSPAVGLDTLIKARNEGTIDAVIASLRPLDDFAPDLKVLKVEEWTDELCHFMAKRALLADA